MNKKEFQETLERIKSVSKQNLEAHTEVLIRPDYARSIENIAKFDPELARLCEEADRSPVEPLRRLVAYLAKRSEN